MFCRECGKQISNNASICPGCGVSAGNGSNFCPACASELEPGSEFCRKCGTKLLKATRSKLAAGLLGIFLGSWGIHRFYLGYSNIYHLRSRRIMGLHRRNTHTLRKHYYN